MHTPVLLAAVCALLAPASQSRDGYGWSMTRLDLDVQVLPDEKRFELDGTMRVRLDARSSSRGPDLLVNMHVNGDRDPVMRFTDVACEGADARVLSEVRSGGISQAEVRFDKAKRRGDEIAVSFAAVSEGRASQLLVEENVAIASWTAAWHPFTNPSSTHGLRFDAPVLHAPGRTRLHLPAGWIGIIDGELIERERTDQGTVEVWETPDGIARSFAAGPYNAVTKEVDGRRVHVYMLSEDKPLGPKRLARLIADTMAAQEARLGPFPFGSCGVVEVPSPLPGQLWAAASQQTFIVARTGSFDYEHGNLPLWGHEMAHAWWGNTVGSHGTGSAWCGESLAQLGGLITIETLEGPEALREYLAFSREGFHPLACASGYFTIVRNGMDVPLSRVVIGGSNGAGDVLVDSKGMWVYHMLRQVVGDEVFFGVLRDVIADEKHGSISMDDMRRRFVKAAPERDLKTFFAQWLDREGAPVLDFDWYARRDRLGLVLRIEQLQEGKPFVFDLDVEVELADGERVVEHVEVREAEHTFELRTPSRPAGVRLDPAGKLLLWRPEYGPRPGDKTADPQAPEEVLEAVVGTYRILAEEKEVEIFRRDGELFVQVGSTAIRLVYESEGTFHTDVPGNVMTARFDLSESPAPSFIAVEDGKEYVVERVGR